MSSNLIRNHSAVPRDFPVLREKSIKVEPGKKTLCGAGRPGKAGHPQPPPHPGQVLSSSGILDLAPEDSKCYFSHLHLYAKYSLVNCRWESLRTSLCQLLQVWMWPEAGWSRAWLCSLVPAPALNSGNYSSNFVNLRVTTWRPVTPGQGKYFLRGWWNNGSGRGWIS